MNTALQRALEDAGMSQSELARRLGIHASQVNRWVKRTLRPTEDQLKAAVEVLGVDGPMSIGYDLEPRSAVIDA